jgi:hypothetical protein
LELTMSERELRRHEPDEYDEPDFDEPEDENEDVDLDFDGADRLKAEATRRPVRFRYKGEVIEIPHIATWPTRATLAIQRGDLETWINLVVGEDDVDLFLDMPQAVFDKVTDLVMKDAESYAGEARRSSRTPRSTQKRSKRR